MSKRDIMKPDYKAIGSRLKEARNLKNMTQQKLADSMDISVSYVKNTERGGKPSIEYLLVVADKCHVSLDWLLTGVHVGPDKQLEDRAPTQKSRPYLTPT